MISNIYIYIILYYIYTQYTLYILGFRVEHMFK